MNWWKVLDTLFLRMECYRLADWCHRRWCDGCNAHTLFRKWEETK